MADRNINANSQKNFVNCSACRFIVSNRLAGFSVLLLHVFLTLNASAQQIDFLAIGKAEAESYREKLFDKLEAEKANLKQLRNVTKQNLSQDKRKLRAEIEECQESIRQLQEKGNNLPGWRLPIVKMPPDTVGVVGLIENREMRWTVIQVISTTEMLAKLGSQMMLVKGISTENLVDDDRVTIPQSMPIIVGKSTYTTAIGGTNTVYTIQTLLHELNEFLQTGEAEKVPGLKPFSFREWTSSSGKFKVQASMLRFEKGLVTLKKSDNQEVNVKLIELSDDDKRFVKEWVNP